MPLGDEKFYTMDGVEIDRSVLVQYMIDYFNSKYPDSQITDFNEGSEIRNILEAFATIIYHLEWDNQQLLRAAFLPTSWGNFLDLFGEELNTPRYNATNAWGTVTFSIAEPVLYNITIPYGTVLVSETTGLYYVTNLDVEIPIGETSADCPIYSQIAGANTNAKAETITLFKEDNIYKEVRITNNEEITGGRDEETDENYRKRLMQVKSQDHFGSREYYTRLGLSVKGVHDVILTTSATNTAKVVINGYTKPLPSTILAQVNEVYSSLDNIVYNHSFEIEETGYTSVNLEITVGVTDEVSDSIFTDLLNLFFNGGSDLIYNQPRSYNGLNINETLTNYQLLTILETLPFVVQVTSLTSNNETFKKLIPDTDSVLTLGTVVITQELVE